MKKKIFIIAVVLIGLLGISYAWFNYYGESSNYQIGASDLFLSLDSGTDTVTLQNVFPETVEEARGHANNDNVITFSVSGRNTSDKDIQKLLSIVSILANLLWS